MELKLLNLKMWAEQVEQELFRWEARLFALTQHFINAPRLS